MHHFAPSGRRCCLPIAFLRSIPGTLSVIAQNAGGGGLRRRRRRREEGGGGRRRKSCSTVIQEMRAIDDSHSVRDQSSVASRLSVAAAGCLFGSILPHSALRFLRSRRRVSRRAALGNEAGAQSGPGDAPAAVEEGTSHVGVEPSACGKTPSRGGSIGGRATRSFSGAGARDRTAVIERRIERRCRQVMARRFASTSENERMPVESSEAADRSAGLRAIWQLRRGTPPWHWWRYPAASRC